jgi:hypothetical protein
MKAFILAVAATFVGGLLLIATALVASEALKGDRTFQESPEELRQIAQHSVRLVDHGRVEGMQNFTVRGIAQNIGDEPLSIVELRIDLRVAGAKVNECKGMIFDEFAPGTRQSFQIVCRDAVGTGLPAGTTYDLVVDSAG